MFESGDQPAPTSQPAGTDVEGPARCPIFVVLAFWPFFRNGPRLAVGGIKPDAPFNPVRRRRKTQRPLSVRPCHPTGKSLSVPSLAPHTAPHQHARVPSRPQRLVWPVPRTDNRIRFAAPARACLFFHRTLTKRFPAKRTQKTFERPEARDTVPWSESREMTEAFSQIPSAIASQELIE